MKNMHQKQQFHNETIKECIYENIGLRTIRKVKAMKKPENNIVPEVWL